MMTSLWYVLPVHVSYANMGVAKESAVKRLRIRKADDSYQSVGVCLLLLRANCKGAK